MTGPSVTAKPGRTPGALFATAVVAGPALLLWHLRGLWNPDGAYAYGWVVPFLAAFLCKTRWDDRPPASSPVEGAAFFAMGFALLALPALWLEEAAPERSIGVWAYAIGCIGTALSLIALAGGFAWLRWFGFPFAFILTAAPWPYRFEKIVSNFLMRGTARATVEILFLIGVPSRQSGNLVHLETGIIDIDEACSGIRSLQAMVMISLFLGELFRLRLGRRLALVAFGLGVTLLANVLRTVALSWIGFGQGIGAVDGYHDAAGLAVLLLSLSATLLAAVLLRPAKDPAPVSNAETGLRLPVKLGAALLVWFIVQEISVEAWYRSHEPKWQGWSWAVAWPRRSEGFHFIEIPERSLRVLLCDESRAASWKEPDGSEWSAYSVRWKPGNAVAEAAKAHSPDACLAAQGAIMEKDMGVNLVSVGRLRMPFHGYTFRMAEKTLYVFFCLYEEGASPAVPSNPRFEAIGVIQRALEGRRNVGEQSLELVASGYPSALSAQEAFKARVGELVQLR